MYGDFKLKKPFSLHYLYKNILALQGLIYQTIIDNNLVNPLSPKRHFLFLICFIIWLNPCYWE